MVKGAEMAEIMERDIRIEYTRIGGGTTYEYPAWRVNEWSVDQDGNPYRWVELANFETEREAVAFMGQAEYPGRLWHTDYE